MIIVFLITAIYSIESTFRYRLTTVKGFFAFIELKEFKYSCKYYVFIVTPKNDTLPAKLDCT